MVMKNNIYSMALISFASISGAQELAKPILHVSEKKPFEHLKEVLPINALQSLILGYLPDWEESQILHNHQDRTVTTAKFSPCGQYLASNSEDTIKIWQQNNDHKWVCIQTLKDYYNWIINSITFSADSQYIAAGFNDGTIQIWYMKNNQFILYQTIQSYPIADHLKAHCAGITSITFSSNGKYLATASADETIKIWCHDNDNKWKCHQTLNDHKKTVDSLAFSPDSSYLASGARDNTIKIWQHKKLDNFEWFQCAQTLIGHTDLVRSIAISPNGKYLASASDDKTAMIWQLDQNNQFVCKQLLKGHSKFISSIAFSPNSECIATGSHDKTIKIWQFNHDHFTCINTCQQHTDDFNSNNRIIIITSVAFASNGTLACVSSFIKIWNNQKYGLLN
jgi:WD40 repeat protein